MNKTIRATHTRQHEEILGLPVGQVNAHLSDELVMRVGVPHRGGRLAFHAFNEGFPVMVSASCFWDAGKQRFRHQEPTNLLDLDFALDSAGFTAMATWAAKGTQPGMAGVFPWGMEQYAELGCMSGASWWAQPDLCVEKEIAGSQEEIDYRIDATATLLEGVLRILYKWQNILSRTCSAQVVANMIRPPVPVIQGRSVSDYLRSLDLLMAVWDRWTPWLALPSLIGVGSICRRNLHHKTDGLYAILAALEPHMPAGSKAHLFGVKGACLDQLKMHKWIASADSMAYDFGARVKAHRGGHSNTLAHRGAEMSRWMSAASQRLAPKAGDQFLLSFRGE